MASRLCVSQHLIPFIIAELRPTPTPETPVSLTLSLADPTRRLVCFVCPFICSTMRISLFFSPALFEHVSSLPDPGCSPFSFPGLPPPPQPPFCFPEGIFSQAFPGNPTLLFQLLFGSLVFPFCPSESRRVSLEPILLMASSCSPVYPRCTSPSDSILFLIITRTFHRKDPCPSSFLPTGSQKFPSLPIVLSVNVNLG